MSRRANIFAELTPPGRGGISTLALIGSDVRRIAGEVFRPKRGSFPAPGRIAYGHLLAEDGSAIDEIILRNVGGADETAEVEIHCHGGPAAVRAAFARLEAAGLQSVEWTDYLAERAARLGTPRIVLESELMLPGLATLRAAFLVLMQRNGLLRDAVERAARLASSGSAADARAALDDLVAAYDRTGRRIETQPRVAILGAPNVGKSSLLNRLVGRERAIVADIPGTTRDVVTETADLAGLAVELADTAGLRDGGDLVEQLGVERARAEARRADVLLYLLDLSRPPMDEERRWAGARPAHSVLVGTKADLVAPGAPPAAVDVATSAVTGQGLDELAGRILSAMGFRWPPSGQAVPFTARQASALRDARAALARADTRAAVGLLESLLA